MQDGQKNTDVVLPPVKKKQIVKDKGSQTQVKKSDQKVLGKRKAARDATPEKGYDASCEATQTPEKRVARTAGARERPTTQKASQKLKVTKEVVEEKKADTVSKPKQSARKTGPMSPSAAAVGTNKPQKQVKASAEKGKPATKSKK